MDLYQAGYFRLGKQGLHAGWSIVAPSEGMSPVAKEGFKGIAANLTELKSSGNMPSHCMGLFEYENFVYLMHINYNATGEDSRGVSYTHGYVFSRKEYYELCKKPEMLFGVKQEAFPMECNVNETSYPIENNLPYQTFQIQVLLDKYGLDKASYRKLVLAVISSVSENDSSLTIKYQCEPEEYMTVYREIMYLIMSGMPYHLRIRVSTYSFGGSNAKICISNEIGSGNYFDLNSKETNCGMNRVMNYRFTMLYNNYIVGEDILNSIFAAIGDFMQEVFPEALKAPNCEQIEAAFHGLQKKTIEKGTANSLLATFLALQPKVCDTTDSYLATLLNWIFEEQTIIQNRDVYSQLFYRQSKSRYERFITNFIKYCYMEIILADKNNAIEKLWELKQKNTNTSENILEIVKTNNRDLYDSYYIRKYLPNVLSDIPAVKQYLQGDEDGMSNSVYCEYILRIFKRLAEKNLRMSDDYFSLEKIKKNIIETANYMPEDKLDKKAFIEFLEEIFWEQFDINTFRVQFAYDIYVSNTAIERYSKARNLNELVEYIHNPSGDSRLLYEILVEEKILTKENARQDFKDFVNKEILTGISIKNTESFDLYLMCFYIPETHTFEVDKWVHRIQVESKQLCFEPERLMMFMHNSQVLKSESKRRDFMASMTSVLGQKKLLQQRYGKQTVAILQRCCDIMNNKTVGSAIGANSRFLFAFHRFLIGLTAMMTMGLVIRSLWKYYFPEKIFVTVIIAVATLIIILAVMLAKQFVSRKDLEETLESMGTTGVASVITYILSALVIITSALCILFLIKIFYAGIIYLAICTCLAMIMTCVFAIHS